jgi:hypothetical protein
VRQSDRWRWTETIPTHDTGMGQGSSERRFIKKDGGSMGKEESCGSLQDLRGVMRTEVVVGGVVKAVSSGLTEPEMTATGVNGHADKWRIEKELFPIS